MCLRFSATGASVGGVLPTSTRIVFIYEFEWGCFVRLVDRQEQGKDGAFILRAGGGAPLSEPLASDAVLDGTEGCNCCVADVPFRDHDLSCQGWSSFCEVLDCKNLPFARFGLLPCCLRVDVLSRRFRLGCACLLFLCLTSMMLGAWSP